MFKYLKTLMIGFFMLFSLSSCANYPVYTITEAEMVSYLKENLELDKSVNIPGIVAGQIALSNMDVGLGRIANDRLNIKAQAEGYIQVLNNPQQSIKTIFSFSAIPYYNVEDAAVYLKQLQLDSIQVEPFELGDTGQEVAQMILPVINIFLENQPVYEVDQKSFTHTFLNNTDPILVIRDHKLVLSINNEI